MSPMVMLSALDHTNSSGRNALTEQGKQVAKVNNLPIALNILWIHILIIKEAIRSPKAEKNARCVRSRGGLKTRDLRGRKGRTMVN